MTSRLFARKGSTIAAVIAACSIALNACSSIDPGPEHAAPLPTPVTEAARSQAGSVVHTEKTAAGTLGEVDTVIYRSTDGVTGQPTEVSAAFVLPTGQPPKTGWPVVSIGHGTTGIAPDCGPTLQASTLGDVGPAAELTRSGFAVALVDYQGLGVAAVRSGATAAHPDHPYLEPRTAAYNLADAVRAMRRLYPGAISNSWAAAGHSQGGQAAWAAAEFDPAYSPELQLEAALAMAPAVNLVPISGITPGDGIPSDRAWIMPELITGLSVSNPDLHRWDFLRGRARSDNDLLISCNPSDAEKRQAATDAITVNDVSPSNDAAASTLLKTLAAYSLPQRRTSVPLYVMQGTSDPVVPQATTTGAVKGACALGSALSYHQLAGRDHDIGDDTSGYHWLERIMRGGSFTSTCASTK